MARVLRYFMWGYQELFQIGIDLAARSVFNTLDSRLDPKVFLLGFRTNDNPERHPVCIQPEESRYEISLFEDIPGSVENREMDENGRIEVSPDSHHQSIIDENRFRISYLEPLKVILAREDEHSGFRSFASWPIHVHDYLVTCILQLKSDAFDSYYTLCDIGQTSDHRRYASFPEALTDDFLEVCNAEMRLPDPGDTRSTFRYDAIELFHRAGRRFMSGLSSICETPEGGYGLFSDICNISKAMYEGAHLRGGVILTRRDHPRITKSVAFAKPVHLSDSQGARKVLEMAGQNEQLLSDGLVLYGLGHMNKKTDDSEDDIFRLSFTGHYEWELAHAGNVMMRARYGVPSLPEQAVDEERLVDTAERIFDNIDSNQRSRLVEIANAASNQKHGALIVISKDAKEEAWRLADQSRKIEPVQLNASLVDSLTSIDGAVIVDIDGVCHAAGVVLDGPVCNMGTSSRGARYNSAIRYVQNVKQRNHRCIAIVVSEDGPVTIIPELVPRIDRSLLEKKLNDLEVLSRQETVESRDYNISISWLDINRKYIGDDDAAKINSLRDKLMQKIEEKSRIWYFGQFNGNPEIDESYFS